MNTYPAKNIINVAAIYFSNPAEFYPFQKEFESLLQKAFFGIYNMHKL